MPRSPENNPTERIERLILYIDQLEACYQHLWKTVLQYNRNLLETQPPPPIDTDVRLERQRRSLVGKKRVSNIEYMRRVRQMRNYNLRREYSSESMPGASFRELRAGITDEQAAMVLDQAGPQDARPGAPVKHDISDERKRQLMQMAEREAEAMEHAAARMAADPKYAGLGYGKPSKEQQFHDGTPLTMELDDQIVPDGATAPSLTILNDVEDKK